jgi:hypothetical protein
MLSASKRWQGFVTFCAYVRDHVSALAKKGDLPKFVL